MATHSEETRGQTTSAVDVSPDVVDAGAERTPRVEPHTTSLVAWDMPGVVPGGKFRNGGRANVRNVTLPANTSHTLVPVTADFVENEQELLDEWFHDAESVGICGATSTPSRARTECTRRGRRW